VSAEPERCLTCSDDAIAARVRSVDGLEALVAVDAGAERVAIDLVPDARPGDLLLCHAGIALERLEEAVA
jgi:hydrogenase maturation factor